MEKVISRKYYKNRLFKITTKIIAIGRNACRGFRYVKYYEKRECIGHPWKLINGTTYDFNGSANIGGLTTFTLFGKQKKLRFILKKGINFKKNKFSDV